MAGLRMDGGTEDGWMVSEVALRVVLEVRLRVGVGG